MLNMSLPFYKKNNLHTTVWIPKNLDLLDYFVIFQAQHSFKYSWSTKPLSVFVDEMSTAWINISKLKPVLNFYKEWKLVR